MNAQTHVLVIEDNPGDARLVATYLDESPGPPWAVRQAGTLAEGLLSLRHNDTDIVLLDLGLPDSQGLGGYRELSRQAPQMPVVIMTGRDDDVDALDALSLGAEDYLAKHSVDGPTLVRALRHAVNRRHLTNRLRESESRFRALVETAEEGILQLDRSGMALYLNARAHRILDLAEIDPDESQGLRGWVAPASLGAVDELLCTQAGARTSRDLRLFDDAEGERWACAAAGGIAVPEGTEPQTVLLLTDISGRRRTEAELVRLRAHLESLVADRTARLDAANVELRAVNRAMAHDLRTPLHGILGMTHLVKGVARDVLPHSAWSWLLMVEQSAMEMSDLINGLLSLGELGRQELVRSPLDLSAMAETVARRLEAADPGRIVYWQIDPGVTAHGDRALVAAVLQNLLENAWKYSSQVQAPFIEFSAQSRPNTPTVYRVSDNGVGFDMNQAVNLFQAFERMPSAAPYAGSGLGLSGVRLIVARHGGKVWAESTLGRGSVFFFTLEPDPAAS